MEMKAGMLKAEVSEEAGRRARGCRHPTVIIFFEIQWTSSLTSSGTPTHTHFARHLLARWGKIDQPWSVCTPDILVPRSRIIDCRGMNQCFWALTRVMMH